MDTGSALQDAAIVLALAIGLRLLDRLLPQKIRSSSLLKKVFWPTATQD